MIVCCLSGGIDGQKLSKEWNPSSRKELLGMPYRAGICPDEYWCSGIQYLRASDCEV